MNIYKKQKKNEKITRIQLTGWMILHYSREGNDVKNNN